MMPMEKHLNSVSVIVPVLNGAQMIGDCIVSLLRQNFPNEQYEIVVVDNGSADNTCQQVLQYPVRLIHCANKGPAAARNKGIREARNELLLFVDADCIAHPELVQEHVSAHLKLRAQGGQGQIVGGGIEGRNKNFWSLCDDFCSWSFFHKKLPHRKLRNMCPTANMSLLKTTATALNGFDENLLFGEDYAFCQKAVHRGCNLFFRPRAVVEHRNRTTYKGFMEHSVKWAEADADLYEKGIFTVRKNMFSFMVYYGCFIPAFLLQPLVFGLWARRIEVLFVYPIILYNRIKIALLRMAIHNKIRRKYLLVQNRGNVGLSRVLVKE